MERIGIRSRLRRPPLLDRCTCEGSAKYLFALFAALIIVNVVTAFNCNNPLISKLVQKLASRLGPASLLQPSARERALHQQQCDARADAFSDPYNETLRRYADYDTEEARLKYALSDMLDAAYMHQLEHLEREGVPRFSLLRARLSKRVRMVAKNVMMDYNPLVLQGLLARVKNPIDRHYRSLHYRNVRLYSRYRSCAVIGNSGEILKSRRGQFIDDHEAVIRINNAKPPTLTSEANPLRDYIGAKTTVMFINSHVLHRCSLEPKCPCHPFGRHVPIILYLCHADHLAEVALCGREHRAPLMITDRRLDLLVMKIARWYSIARFMSERNGSTGWRRWEALHYWEAEHRHEFHFSTGMLAVVFALGVCERVDLLGFGKNSSFLHHFHSGQRAENHGHDYKAEYAFYDDLARGRVAANPFLCPAQTYIPPVRVFH